MTLRPPRSIVRPLLLAVLLACGSLSFPARAVEPLLMFVLGFARNLIDSAIEENAAKPRRSMGVPAAPAKAPASMDETDLRALVDESFSYLSRAQRDELLAGLDKALGDPANHDYREAILTQFVNVARQVKFTHGQLERLSAEDKRALVDRFAANYRSLAPAQRQALMEQLKVGALPLPSDLNDMMLTALSATP